MNIISRAIYFLIVIYAGELAIRKIKKEHPELDFRNPLVRWLFPRKEKKNRMKTKKFISKKASNCGKEGWEI